MMLLWNVARCGKSYTKCKNLILMQNKIKWCCLYPQNITILCGKQSLTTYKQCFSTISENRESSIDEDLGLDESRTSQYLLNSSNYFKDVLYPNSNDEVISKLKSCRNSSDIFEIIDSTSRPTSQQVTQAVLTLRGVQKICSDSLSLKNFLDNEIGVRLVQLVYDTSSDMNLEELSCCILYLQKIGVDNSKLLPIITMFESKMKAKEITDISLTSLARICIAVRDFRNLWSLYTCLEMLPLLKYRLDSCDNYGDFRRITICFQKMVPFLPNDLLNTYVQKSLFLLEKQADPKENLERMRTIVKAVIFLNFKAWEGEYTRLVRNLILSLRGHLNKLRSEDLISLHIITLTLDEPYEILIELKSSSSQLIHTTEDIRDLILLIRPLFVFPGDRNVNLSEISPHMEKFLDMPNLNIDELFLQADLFVIFLTYYGKESLTVSNKYWNKIIEVYDANIDEITKETVFALLSRYVSWRNISGNSHESFERAVPPWLHRIREKYQNILNPSDFNKLILYLLYFNHWEVEQYSSSFQKILFDVPRINIYDVISMAFLLSSTFNVNHKLKKSKIFLSFYVQATSEMNKIIYTYLEKNSSINLNLLSSIFRIYYSLGGTKYSDLFRMINTRLSEISTEQLSAKTMKTIIPGFFSTKYINTLLMDKFINYCIQHEDLVNGSTLSHVIAVAFKFGYSPKRCDKFVQIVGRLLYRDCEMLSTHQIINTALALCFYNNIPQQLVDYIFNIKFLQILDEGIQSRLKPMSRKQMHYNFLELNRTVCLESPAHGVPWFHENLCKENIVLGSQRRNETSLEVERALRECINDEKSIQINHYSPYYHRIDFVLNLNRSGEPVNPGKCKPEDLRKVAILINNRMSSSPHYFGKGIHELHVRQLEILGYKVAEIDKHQWNSMYMSEPAAKENYLYNLIWPFNI